MTSALGKSWKDTFRVNTKEEAEKELIKQGFQWEWLSQNRLKTIGPPMAILKKQDENDILFTAAETIFLRQKYIGRPEKSFIHGNGDPLQPDEKEAFENIYEKLNKSECTRIPWQKNDILIIHNHTVMHARDSFTPPRRILAALLQ